jgi:hypothetical protein
MYAALGRSYMARTEPVSRRKKLSHLDTILYEIDMLEYCYSRLLDSSFADERDYFLFIEGFLLHYRNLIQFFGNHHDLKADEPNIWSPKRLTDAELASIQDGGPFKRHNGQISQYLSHCTKSRAIADRDWSHVAMYQEIEKILRRFRELFPSQQRQTGKVSTLGADSMSTATISHHQFFANDLSKLPYKRSKGGV